MQDRTGAVSPRGAHDAAARMGPRAAHVQVLQGRPVVAKAGRGPRVGQLVEAERAMEDVALVQAKVLLEVERRQRVVANDRGRKVGGKLVHNGEDALDKGLFELGIRPAANLS